MRNRNSLGARLGLATLLVMSVAVTQWPLPSKSATIVSLNLKSASQIISEAKIFEGAVQSINGITALNLKDAASSKTTETILETNVPKLKLIHSRLLAIALTDSTLIGAAKARASDQKSAEQFALEVCQDANAILKLSGAVAVRDKMQSTLQSDIDKIQKTAQYIRDNEAAQRAMERAQLLAAISTAAMITAAIILVVVAVMVAVFTFGAAVATIAGAVAAGSIAVGAAAAAARAAQFVAAAAVSAGASAADAAADKVEACSKKADSKYKSCKSDAYKLVGPAVGLALEACKATWVYEAAKCLVTD